MPLGFEALGMMPCRRGVQSLRWAAALAAVLTLLSGACDRKEHVRASLKVHEQEWTARLTALRAHQSEIVARLDQIPAVAAGRSSDSGKWQAARLRAQAAVDGNRQILSDIE